MEKKVSKREWNKTRHKEAILEAAERLFLQRGFDSTSIDDVAKEAGLTKRTLYQYFLSKDDLFYAVALKGARLLTATFEQGLGQGSTVLDKIRLANDMHLQFYQNHLGLFRILNYRPSDLQDSMASPHFRELAMLDANRMRLLVDLVEEGRADGSIKPDLDMKKALLFAFFSAFSLLYTVSSMDKSMWDALQLDENEFLRFCFSLLSDALRP